MSGIKLKCFFCHLFVLSSLEFEGWVKEKSSLGVFWRRYDPTKTTTTKSTPAPINATNFLTPTPTSTKRKRSTKKNRKTTSLTSYSTGSQSRK